MERLPRLPRKKLHVARLRPERASKPKGSLSGFAAVGAFYAALYDKLTTGEVFIAETGDLTGDPIKFTREVKSTAYFLDAAIVSSGPIDVDAWYATSAGGELLVPTHKYAFVFAVEPGRAALGGTLAEKWLVGAHSAGAQVRVAQIASIIAGYIRALGHDAQAHTLGRTDIELAVAAKSTGLARLDQQGRLINPFLGTDFILAAVTTNLVVEDDLPLAPNAGQVARRDWRYAIGWGGTTSWFERWHLGRSAAHLGRYPVGKIRRVARPTTQIFDDEVPQVSARALFYARAAHGDLGEKAQTEVFRFVRKHPLAMAIRPVLDAAVAHQDGPPAAVAQGSLDPAENAKAVKALCHHLGADLVGIGPAPRYVWYSHDKRGEPIIRHHPHAIVIAVDQGQETMEGSSGDDWISGSQSSRAYMRGAEIAGLVARQLRSLGYNARAHSNVDSQVLHTPLLLLCGIGELSRIGEVILNPFIGPRFKSAIVTTDMPLAHDGAVDFGLQQICNSCMKCARECPCTAISFGDKVIFNGYEIWKPDVERCTRYRLTNAKGSSCGRCIKVCPFNHEGILAYRIAVWAAVKLPWFRKWIPILDDWIGHGLINPVKTWWSDFEILGGQGLPWRTVRPSKGTNHRGLGPGKTARLQGAQKIAYYHANMMPPPNQPGPFPLNRNEGLEAAKVLETPAMALERKAAGEPAPAHYTPPSALPEDVVGGRKLISN
ncbi:MAG: reductive dehalogenase domain-containing protein [Rhodospirillaceae bacterium]|nr:reductive dehalogenase domain-containing protein [Rhodospirillaceae bacterium]